MTFHYSVYGLCIKSELKCPVLTSSDIEPADVTIQLGNLNHIDYTDSSHSKNYRISTEELLIDIKSVAKYFVNSGHSIIIDPYKGALESEIQLFLQGAAIAAILHQRSYVPIHGNGITMGGKCIIFAGHSGRGKSTLANAFINKGAKLISDDICAIKVNQDEQLLVYPGAPHIKLWSHTAQHFSQDISNMPKAINNDDKYIFPLRTSHADTASKLDSIYALHFHDHNTIKFEPLNKKKAVTALINYTYKKKMVGTMGATRQHIALCHTIANSIPVTRVYRPQDLRRIDQLVDYFIHNVMLIN